MHSIIPQEAFKLELNSIPLVEYDMGGVLYHANYFHLYEQGREALLTDIGSPYINFVTEGCHLAVTESSQKFIKPVYYGDKLNLCLWLSSLKRGSMQFNYALLSVKGSDVIHRASTTHAFVCKKQDGFKVSAIPENLRDRLKPYIFPNYNAH